jgi:septal ring factor EnvC (AmiA/AmiB activator)
MNIEERVTRLEESVANTKERLATIDKEVAVFGTLLERNFTIQEKLSTAIDNLSNSSNEVKVVLTKMQSEIQTVGTNVDELRKKFTEVDTIRRQDVSDLKLKISAVETKSLEKINTVDEKGKLDWQILLKSSLSDLVKGVFFGVGILGIIVMVIEYLK